MPRPDGRMPTKSIFSDVARGVTSGIVLPEYDSISVSYPDGVTEVYEFKKNGSSGQLVGTITVTYTDSTKENLSSISKV